jgi:hypothetical protein
MNLDIVFKLSVFSFGVLLTDAVNCQDCVVSVVDKCVSMERWWDCTDRGDMKRCEVLWPP